MPSLSTLVIDEFPTNASQISSEFTNETQIYDSAAVRELCKLQENASEIIRLPICSTQEKKVFSQALTYTLLVCISFVMFTMGCKVKIREILHRFKVPYGILTGFLCQFGIMPLLSFALANLLSLPRAQALAVLIMGCIPGGNASNLLCYWCGGDLDLSIAMTTVSTLLAFAMMPLCLFLYGRTWTSDAFSIPFAKISFILACFIVPVSIGIGINFWKPKVAEKVAKVGAVLGIIVLIIAGCLGILLYPDAWHIPTSFWIVGAILPMAGYACGYAISSFLAFVTKSEQLNLLQIRTIAIETGMQNTQMCTAMIQVNYTCTCMILEMYAYPLVYFMYQVAEAMLFCATYQVYKFILRSKSSDITSSTRDGGPEGVSEGRSVYTENPRPRSLRMTTFGEVGQAEQVKGNNNCVIPDENDATDKNKNVEPMGTKIFYPVVNTQEEQTRL